MLDSRKTQSITTIQKCSENATLKSKIDGAEVNHKELKEQRWRLEVRTKKKSVPRSRQQRLSLVLRSARCKVVVSQSGAGAA
jgi:hypothetical protein